MKSVTNRAFMAKKQNLLFNQLTAMPKRLAMVLTVLLVVGIGQVWEVCWERITRKMSHGILPQLVTAIGVVTTVVIVEHVVVRALLSMFIKQILLILAILTFRNTRMFP